MRKLRRSPGNDSLLGGVCSGIAYSAGIPVWCARLGVVVLVLALGTGVLAYALLWALLPEWETGEPADFALVTGD